MQEILGNKYTVCEKLGEGGSGRVYRGYDRHLQCDVAIKEFGAEDGISAKELAILKELRHPALPMITDFLEEGENTYLVMEYIDGRNLEEYIREMGRIPQEKAVRWAVKLADVLIYLHERERPVIYRDMKPANIMIDGKGDIWLVDFGTAYLHYHEEKDAFFRAGTHGYGAPELFGGKGTVDERSDIYGLGATLFHMLTGSNPALPPYLMQPIRAYDRCFSVELERIVAKATQEDKEGRYQSVRQLKEELQEYKRADRRRIGIGKGIGILYHILLLGLFFHFFSVCMATGVLHIEWIQEELLKSRVSFREIEMGRAACQQILQAAFWIFVLCTVREAVHRWGERKGRMLRQGRNLLLTAKRGRGLMLTVFAGVLAVSAVSSKVWAREGSGGDLTIHVRNAKGQKVLIRYDAVYPLDGTLRLELPLENFEEGKSYELGLECIDPQTGESRNKTFYLKRLEP